jgi:hypothetical protein
LKLKDLSEKRDLFDLRPKSLPGNARTFLTNKNQLHLGNVKIFWRLILSAAGACPLDMKNPTAMVFLINPAKAGYTVKIHFTLVKNNLLGPTAPFTGVYADQCTQPWGFSPRRRYLTSKSFEGK